MVIVRLKCVALVFLLFIFEHRERGGFGHRAVDLSSRQRDLRPLLRSRTALLAAVASLEIGVGILVCVVILERPICLRLLDAS